MNEKIDVIGIMLVAGEVAASHGLYETHDALKEARAAIAELIEENTAMRELLRVQDEAMTAYRELVEHRNRQIYALGGEL